MGQASTRDEVVSVVLTLEQWKALPKTARRFNKRSAPRREVFIPVTARWAPALIIGNKFPCPECGAVDAWKANYVVPADQGVELRVDDDGTPDAIDYNGDEEYFDSEVDEYYQCGACQYMLAPDGTQYVTPKLSDRAALDEIHKWMSGRMWDGAADFLEAIAEVVASTGRTILPAGADAKVWNEDDTPKGTNE